MARWRVLLLAWLAFIPLALAAQARDGMSLEQVAQTRTVTRAAISPTGSDIA